MRFFRACALMLLGWAYCAQVLAESFSYELFAMEADGRRLMSKGVREHTASDSIATERDATGRLDKQLQLGNGFSVGLSDYSEASVTGIGFWLRKVPSPMEVSQYDGFSWEWFDQDNGQIFSKRKGAGRIKLGTQRVGGRERVQRVEFLDDIVFQANVNEQHEPGSKTHELLIRKGSALVFVSEPGTGR